VGSFLRLQEGPIAIVNVLVDTSVWSLALRRDAPPDNKETAVLARCLERQDILFTTGLIVQELLQGFRGPKQRERLIEHLSSLPLIVPDLSDHIAAAELRTTCRQKGLQIGTIDALLAQLAIGHDLEFLTSDRDFTLVSRYVPLRILTEN
jgi:predicted nucleic acid-binding protein